MESFFLKPNRQNRTVYSITVYEPNRAYEPENWNLTEPNRTVAMLIYIYIYILYYIMLYYIISVCVCVCIHTISLLSVIQLETSSHMYNWLN